MSNEFLAFFNKERERVNVALQHYLHQSEAPSPLKEAMEYSLLAGGKRIRPIFLLSTLEALGKPSDRGLAAACALEMIHTYSLIHDDLPAMDDDDYRRGKLTNHKVHGEALAILAGDALLTHAFYLLGSPVEGVPADVQGRVVQEVSLRAGVRGMVAGQVFDMLGEKKELTFDELVQIHQHKTADLLICSVRLGCLLGQATQSQLEELTTYATNIGMAFQIQDDILDEIGDQEKLGKDVGSDRENGKTTYVSLLGLDEAKSKLNEHVDQAKQALLRADVDQTILLGLADFMLSREN